MWRYLIDANRAEALSAIRSFETVLERTAQDLQVLCRHVQQCDESAGYRRVAFCATVKPSTFDALFNAEHGYRGAYFRSPIEGGDVNDRLIRTIAPKLIDWADTYPDGDCDIDRVSLYKRSAKVWLAEAGSHTCERCVGEWGHPQTASAEILNDRWECVEDVRGRKAPCHSKLRIFGAFVNDRCDEYVPASKLARAQEIHDKGWT